LLVRTLVDRRRPLRGSGFLIGIIVSNLAELRESQGRVEQNPVAPQVRRYTESSQYGMAEVSGSKQWPYNALDGIEHGTRGRNGHGGNYLQRHILVTRLKWNGVT